MKQQQLEAELANAYAKIKLLEEQIEKEISGKAWRERNGHRAKERKEISSGN